MKMLSTKRALFASVLSLLLCVTMLVGSTFAWFTDTATASVNTIKAGTLDVALEMMDNEGNWVPAEGKSLQFLVDGKIPEEGTEILWEPGCTYSLPKLRVKNGGNLALKYKVVLTGIRGDAELNDVIDWTIDGVDLGVTKSLAPKASAEFTITGHMQETAGNAYMGKTIDGISLTVYATQDTAEKDTNGSDYDKDAAFYPVIDETGLKEAIKAGGSISVDKDFITSAANTSTRTTVTVPSTFDLNATITVPGSLEASMNWAALFIQADTTFDASNGGGIYCTNKTDPDASYAGGTFVADVNGEGITVTVNGGTYYGGGTTFQVTKGTLVVNGGFFSVYPDVGTNDYRYVLNCIDSAYKNGSANIIVKGGTFVNFDPSDNTAEGAGTNFVPEGYSVISETKENGDVWYTVVEGTSVSTSDEFADAVKNGENVVLKEDMTLSTALEIPAGKDVTMYLNGKTVTAAKEFVTVNAGAKLTVTGGTVVSGLYAFRVNGGEVVVDGGDYTAQEVVYALFGGSTLTVNDGVFTSKDNAVVATNGSSAEGCDITINGGVFNANITSAGYIACGVYVANKDTVKINAATFNVTDGVGVLMRAGHTTIGEDVVIHLTNTGRVTAGRVGDADIDITTPSYLVMDVRSGYPGASAGFTITNNSAYELVEYK